MNERPSDEALRQWKSQASEVVWDEMRRARASEVAKDATIKALADALEDMRLMYKRDDLIPDCLKRGDAAIRLAGYLP